MTPEALAAVEEAVRAVVEHDNGRLSRMAADLGDDLYMWTRDYGDYGDVDLVMPPGEPSEWSINWTDVYDGRKHVAVDMWTRQEGHSDLTLELHLTPEDTGRWRPHILNLHVL
jgi:hypothetical protein